MEVVNIDGCLYEQTNNLLIDHNTDNESSSVSDSNVSTEPLEEVIRIIDEEDLKEDLQKTIPECYNYESNITSQSCNITNDDEFQSTALCQFMDILNDLDDVLDKSLLACLDDGTKTPDSDDDDLISKIKQYINETEKSLESSGLVVVDDGREVITSPNQQPSTSNGNEDNITDNATERLLVRSLRRSKSYSDISERNRQPMASTFERAGTANDAIRESMRRLDPIVLPALSTQEPCEPLTLPVILFLEHHVNMRPTSAPIQLQLTAANLSSDGATGPLIVGRRALLMNRPLSLPSPGGESDMTTGEWPGRNTARSTGRSTSTSSSSNESLSGAAPQSTNGTAEERNDETETDLYGVWPHNKSAMLAVLSCTLGLFNISRFATFSVHFGVSFIVQFLILSLLIGIPLYTLHICLGRTLEAGPVDMWRISPIFQGVGISLLITHALIGIYSIIGLSWIFVYFRDSFVNSGDRYKWMVPHEYYFDDASSKNETFKLHETLPQYFLGEVLQKSQGSNNAYFGTIKFQVAFNLAVVWMIVFVALSKGLRSYGKAVYMFTILPICGTLILCIKLLLLVPYESIASIFDKKLIETQWSEFSINSNSWAAAMQEVFLTWGLLGASIMQIMSHKNIKAKTSGSLLKESTVIVIVTVMVLFLGSMLANICVFILKNHGYAYIPASFETLKTFQFLWPMSVPQTNNALATPVRYMNHYGSLVGITVFPCCNLGKTISGWQPLQLATEIVPATLAVLPADLMSPVWAVIFYFILILFGIAQQLAIWHFVITGIMAINIQVLRVWETTITFLSCIVGLTVGLFLATDTGITIVHWLDYVLVGAWAQCAVSAALLVGVFVVRGRPYSPDTVAGALFSSRSLIAAMHAALLSFTWSVILPVLLCAMCIMDFRLGQQRQLYSWRKSVGYWPTWARQMAVALQQGILLMLPIIGFVQIWRYMSKGPPDIFERIQNLYRPRLESTLASPALEPPPAPADPSATASAHTPAADPPPKYTPPPSYSTATGARVLNTIRRSFRTLRRITTTSRNETIDDTSQLPITLSESIERERIPPTPETQPELPVNNPCTISPTLTHTDETHPHAHSNPRTSTSRNSLNLTRDFLRRSFVRKSDSAKNIRSSLRRSFRYGGALTTSHERLVREAEPISNTVAMSAMLDSEDTARARSIASVI